MSSIGAASGVVPGTGIFGAYLLKGIYAGKETEESKEVKQERQLDEKKTRISGIDKTYNENVRRDRKGLLSTLHPYQAFSSLQNSENL